MPLPILQPLDNLSKFKIHFRQMFSDVRQSSLDKWKMLQNRNTMLPYTVVGIVFTVNVTAEPLPVQPAHWWSPYESILKCRDCRGTEQKQNDVFPHHDQKT